MFWTRATALLWAVGSLLSLRLVAEPTFVVATGGFHTAHCAQILNLLGTGEVATTPLIPVGANDAVVGTTSRVLKINWKTNEMAFVELTQSPVSSVNHMQNSPWLSFTTSSSKKSPRIAVLKHTASPKPSIKIKLQGFPGELIYADRIVMHPNGTFVLATFPKYSPLPPVFIDIAQRKVIRLNQCMTEGPYGSSFFDNGDQIIFAVTPGKASNSFAYVSGTENVLNRKLKIDYVMTLPRMNPADGPPEIVGSPYDSLFALKVLESPDPQHPENKIAQTFLFDAPLVTTTSNRGAQELTEVAVLPGQEVHSARQGIPYMPPVAFAPGKVVISGTSDGTIEVRKVGSEAEIQKVLVGGHDRSPVTSVASSSDGHYYASGAENGSLTVWTPSLNLGYRISGFTRPIKNLHFTDEVNPSLFVESSAEQNAGTDFYVVSVPPKHF